MIHHLSERIANGKPPNRTTDKKHPPTKSQVERRRQYGNFLWLVFQPYGWSSWVGSELNEVCLEKKTCFLSVRIHSKTSTSVTSFWVEISKLKTFLRFILWCEENISISGSFLVWKKANSQKASRWSLLFVQFESSMRLRLWVLFSGDDSLWLDSVVCWLVYDASRRQWQLPIISFLSILFISSLRESWIPLLFVVHE